VFLLKALIRLIIIATKSLTGLWLGVAVSLMLPLTTLADTPEVDAQFDRNKDGIIDRADWRYMKDDQKKTYARMSLEAIGENPDAIVTKDRTRAQLFLEGLEAIYGR